MIPPYQYIHTQTDLQDACRQMQTETELAFDLEFDDNRFTYGRTLCLVQVASRSNCYIIDPLTCGPLACLWEVLENPAINKVFHSATQDIYLLKESGCFPVNLTDTETVAKLLNYERCSFAQMLSLKLGLSIDKDQQTSNWTKRPLTGYQLEYAAKDVLYLLALKDSLWPELIETGRLAWLEEESLLLEALYPSPNPEPHLKLKEANKLSPYQQHVLKAIYDWRDVLGRKFNQPGPRVISNAVSVALAINPVRDIDLWRRHDGVFGPIRQQSYLNSLVEAIEDAEEEALDRNLPQKPVMPARPPRYFSPQQSAACTTALLAIRQELVNRFGPYTTELILTSTIIKRACWGPPVRMAKRYAYRLIQEVSHELGYQVEEFLTPPDQQPDPAVFPDPEA